VKRQFHCIYFSICCFLQGDVEETVFSPEYFIDNNEKVKYYTGLPNYNVLMAVFRMHQPALHNYILDYRIIMYWWLYLECINLHWIHVPVSTSCSTDTVLVLSVSCSWSKAEAASLCFFFEDLLMFRAYLELRAEGGGDWITLSCPKFHVSIYEFSS
jgi:hypothetical protein